MNYSNQNYDAISTVQLSPFGEGQWNRIVTYSPIYLHWTNLLMMSQKPIQKSKPKKRNLIKSIDLNTIKLEDERLLNQLDSIKRAAMPATLKENNSDNEIKSEDEELGRRTTSPTDEYQKSSEFFYQTRVTPKPHGSHAEPSFSHQKYTTKHSTIQPQTNNIGSIKLLPNINLGPKPQASLSVQLRQSAITRENALGTSTTTDNRSASPLSMASSKRTAGNNGSPRSSRRVNQQYRVVLPQQTPSTDTNVMGGLYEQSTIDSASTIMKKPYPRSTNTSRSTLNMLKTKNERARQKQQMELKTILVNPCRQPITIDGGLEETIPNSIEIMRKLGGPVPAFESNLRFNYNRQLKQYRVNSTK